MAAAGIIYGSSTGNTEKVAVKIAAGLQGHFKTEVIDIAGVGKIDPGRFDLLFIGTSTWGIGKLQEDWELWLPMLEEEKLEGLPVAFFGLGDQDAYPETFCDGMGILYSHFSRKGTRQLGLWDAEGYDFESSKALTGRRFVGLALDEDNQQGLTDTRVNGWLGKVLEEFRMRLE